jgi:hypothetical protein
VHGVNSGRGREDHLVRELHDQLHHARDRDPGRRLGVLKATMTTTHA